MQICTFCGNASALIAGTQTAGKRLAVTNPLYTATPTATSATETAAAAAPATINCHHFLESFRTLHFYWPRSQPVSVLTISSRGAVSCNFLYYFQPKILCAMHLPPFSAHTHQTRLLVYAFRLPCCLLRCNFRYKRR